MGSPIKAEHVNGRPLSGRRLDTSPFFSVKSHKPVWQTLHSAIVRGEGVIVVTGEGGIGKSQLLWRLKGMLPANWDVALIQDAGQSLALFTQTLCRATGTRIAGPDAWSVTPRELLWAIASRIQNGRRFLVAVDRAHRLSEENLAVLNKLILFSVRHGRPIQILLAGRFELIAHLEQPAFQTLRGAIAASATVTPLTRIEVREYIGFRMHKLLGKAVRVTWPAWLEIFAASQGNPQKIDALLQKSLLPIQEKGDFLMPSRLVRQCRMTLDPNYHPPPGSGAMPWVALASLILLVTFTVDWVSSFVSRYDPSKPHTVLHHDRAPSLTNDHQVDHRASGPQILPKPYAVTGRTSSPAPSPVTSPDTLSPTPLSYQAVPKPLLPVTKRRGFINRPLIHKKPQKKRIPDEEERSAPNRLADPLIQPINKMPKRGVENE